MFLGRGLFSARYGREYDMGRPAGIGKVTSCGVVAGRAGPLKFCGRTGFGMRIVKLDRPVGREGVMIARGLMED